jgi:hypothetical protein
MRMKADELSPAMNRSSSRRKDCFVACLSMSESEKPAVAIVLQFSTPLFLGAKAANTVAMSARDERECREAFNASTDAPFSEGQGRRQPRSGGADDLR